MSLESWVMGGRAISVLIVFGLMTPCWAAEKSTGADFLRIEPSARAASMGGAFSALTEDVYSLYYNPAGLALVGRTQFTGTHTEWLAGRQNEFIAAAFPMGSLAWGVSAAYLHSEETERDAVGRPGGTFVVGDGAFSAGIGLRLTERHHIGMNAKFLSRTLYHRTASGYAGDLGYQYRRQTEGKAIWKIGLVVKNLGPEIGFVYKEKLPTEFEAALAWQPSIALRRPLTVSVGARKGAFQKGANAVVGVEGTLFSRLSLRMGYVASGESDEKLRAGFGIDLFELGRIDFAAVRIGQLNSSLLLSLTLQLSRE